MSLDSGKESGADVDFRIALIKAKTILDDHSIPLKKRIEDAITASWDRFRYADNKAAKEAYHRMTQYYKDGKFSDEEAVQIESCIRAASDAMSYKAPTSPTLKPRTES